ncbi:MAG: class I SAM-dependent methyltransferase [Nitrosopumilus sp.]|nr:class I SAM-dependent methyltransferase [Nitrosopumilus sp.]MDF2423087.1 class I SAM-dependent methyltransferase [Nitrosopumilus sp.]MDF2424283.1 class I SAM-dependent methyltransferase [Nitrosopumilus sp.]MDF2425361.1 class I SAM-dependent methyltransferase [Nitrosopumilus sp.]MDF2427095.1 class I SAM-dependent methyltransferase [Nitrosopumilus sp.]
MNKKSAKNLVPIFFNNTANSYDVIVNWTTFGRDSFWKHKILEQLSTEKTVLDLACGTGILTRQIAQKIPNAKITGVDITKNYLEKAKEKSKSYKNISFVVQDAEKLNLGEKFDCITASYLPKYCTSDVLIKNCLEHLNVGGKIILHDFTYPKNKLIQKMWNFYFKVLHVVGFFIPNWRQVFVELPILIRNTNWVQEYEESMKACGLKTFKQDLTLGSSSIIVGTKII